MTELNIVTFNIRCFGFDGDYFGRRRAESRISFLKDFLDSNFSNTDVFVFQEIMNPYILYKILPPDFKMVTYQHDYDRHMFIVFACRKEFEFQAFQTLPGTALDETRSRPAVYTQLVYDNKIILDLIGVHLKSKHDHTKERIEQCQIISKFIAGLPAATPKIMTGDFNSHAKEKTLKAKDDISYIEEIFENQLTLANHNRPTYLSAADTMSLDHFLTSGLQVLDLQVYELPDYSNTSPFKKYFDEISDHLPVSIKVKV